MSTAPASTMSIVLAYDRENGVFLETPKRVVLVVTPDLGDLFARASSVARESDVSLSFTSVLVAMVSGADPVSKWVSDRLSAYGATGLKIAERRSLILDEVTGSSLPSGDLLTSVSARRAIEKARSIADTLGQEPLDVRHLVAAYPILPDWHQRDFQELGIDRLDWVRTFGAYMAGMHPDEKWYWRRYADRASPVPLTSFSADVYTERDLLGIDRTVDALALLIASTHTDTPLSIGIFGEWGSGKSFFMRHLRKRIWTLAANENPRVEDWVGKRKGGKATAQDMPLYYDRIAQVEFNAWHYNEGNLVASLVDHLFRNLQITASGKDGDLAEQRNEVLKQISGVTDELSDTNDHLKATRVHVNDARKRVARIKEETRTARATVDGLATEVAKTIDQADTEHRELDQTIQRISSDSSVHPGAVVDIALQPLTESDAFGKLKGEAHRFAEIVTDWRKFLRTLATPRGAIVAVVCLSVPIVARFADRLSNAETALGSVVAGIVASASQVIAFLRKQRADLEEKLERLDEAEAARRKAKVKELQAKQQEIQGAWDETVRSLRVRLDAQRATLARREARLSTAVKDLAARTRELDDKVEERSAAERKLADLEARLKSLSGALLLDEFIKDRAATDDYSKQLGFRALVRRDFERLSNLITRANEEWKSLGTEVKRPKLNRIVLYIDDLDRCNEDTVLQVLEAVHLLLAFPLFVCVVAVDPRWIEDCLRRKQSGLFGPTGDGPPTVTAGDYLEKIFQIPIWMSPIEPRQRAELVRSLLGTTADPTRAAEPGRPGAADTPASEDAPAAGASRSGPDGFQAAVTAAEGNPDPLRITKEEAEFVELVAPLLSDKPRALKRFVNTYRLLKASLSDIDRASFVSSSPSSAHRICMGQLAFFTGQPRLAPLLARQVESATDGDEDTVSQWLDALSPEIKGKLSPSLSLVPTLDLTPLRDFRSWLPDTSRYLFHRQR